MKGLQHTPRTRARVIEEFRKLGRIDLACAAVEVDRTDHYRWIKRHADYRAAFEEAREQVNGLLEDEAFRRAHHGTMRPVTVAGQLVMVHEFSDQLLMFLLKCRNPSVFGDFQRLQVTGKDGEPLIPLAQWRELVKKAKAEDAAGKAK